MYAYSINTIGQIFYDKAKLESLFRQRKYDLTNYMQRRCISKQLQIKLIRYLEYSYHQECERNDNGQEVISTMNKTLREELYNEYFGKILKSSKIFVLNFGESFLEALALQMKEMSLAPGLCSFN